MLANTRSFHGEEDLPLVLLHQPDELVPIDLREDKLGVILGLDCSLADGTQWRRSSAEAS